MTLSARGIATQGVGHGPRMTALQGFVPQTAPQPHPAGGRPSRRSRDRRRDRDDDALIFLLR